MSSVHTAAHATAGIIDLDQHHLHATVIQSVRYRRNSLIGNLMSDSERDDEHHPGTPAPASGHYHELNIFGSHTGKIVQVEEGEPLPFAPRGFKWRRVMRQGC